MPWDIWAVAMVTTGASVPTERASETAEEGPPGPQATPHCVNLTLLSAPEVMRIVGVIAHERGLEEV